MHVPSHMSEAHLIPTAFSIRLFGMNQIIATIT